MIRRIEPYDVGSFRRINAGRLFEKIEQAPRAGQVVAIFDFDGVLVQGNSSLGFASALARSRLPSFTACAHALLAAGLFSLGYRISYATYGALGRLLSDRTVDEVHVVAQAVVGRLFAHFTDPLIRDLVSRHLGQGHRVIVASGAPLLLVRPFARKLGVALVIATEYAISAGRFTGELAAAPPCGEEKLSRLRRLLPPPSFNLSQSFVYCNDYADRILLDMAGHPVVINPDRRLASLAIDRHWQCFRHAKTVL
jgi:HAD superfamily hydrolase (TIGR01490 family)